MTNDLTKAIAVNRSMTAVCKIDQIGWDRLFQGQMCSDKKVD